MSKLNSTLKDFFEVSKPGILFLVVMTTALGFFLAEKNFSRLNLFLLTLWGSVLCSAGAGALNHYLEKDLDSKMERTKNRPIPAKRLTPNQVLIFGILCSVSGSSLLSWKVNHLSGFLALMTIFLYALVYTPLKRVTWYNTAIGAIPGALPVMGGFAASTGTLSIESWALFLILFAWQHPHFFSIAWILKEDYQRAGFKMLPNLDPQGVRTFFQMKLYSSLLLVCSLLLTFLGTTGIIYGIGAIILGTIMIGLSEKSAETKSKEDVKKVFTYSILYLPLLFVLIAVDVGFSVNFG